MLKKLALASGYCAAMIFAATLGAHADQPNSFNSSVDMYSGTLQKPVIDRDIRHVTGVVLSPGGCIRGPLKFTEAGNVVFELASGATYPAGCDQQTK